MFNSIRRAIRLSRQRSREDNALPFSRQLWEMALLQLITKLGPGNYHKYRLWQKDMPWEEKKGYWHDQKYYGFLDKVNPHKYRIIARNKVVAKSLMQFYGVEDAKYIAYLSNQGSYSACGDILSDIQAFGSFLERDTSLQRVCFKPVEGSGGEGFCAAEIVRDGQLTFTKLGTQDSLPLYDFVKLHLNGLNSCDYIVEQYIEQHPVLAGFNASSLNTLRVWIAKNDKGVSKIVGMYLRVGRKGSLVDNTYAGGFGINVNLQNFETELAIPQDGMGGVFSQHPDTGAQLSGIKLPFIEEVTRMSEKVLNVLPNTKFVGLDIAFSPEKPVLIEFNLTPTPTGVCLYQRSHAANLEWILD